MSNGDGTREAANAVKPPTSVGPLASGRTAEDEEEEEEELVPEEEPLDEAVAELRARIHMVHPHHQLVQQWLQDRIQILEAGDNDRTIKFGWMKDIANKITRIHNNTIDRAAHYCGAEHAEEKQRCHHSFREETSAPYSSQPFWRSISNIPNNGLRYMWRAGRLATVRSYNRGGATE